MAAIAPPTAMIRFRDGDKEATGELLACERRYSADPMVRQRTTFQVRQSEWRWIKTYHIWEDEWGRPNREPCMEHVQYVREFTVYPEEVIEISEGEQVIQFQST
jgi:hypothetical protein